MIVTVNTPFVNPADPQEALKIFISEINCLSVSLEKKVAAVFGAAKLYLATPHLALSPKDAIQYLSIVVDNPEVDHNKRHEAIYLIGLIHLKGKNLCGARAFLQKAFERGYQEAKADFVNVNVQLANSLPDLNQAIYYHTAAINGHGASALLLWDIFFHGKEAKDKFASGVKPDFAKAQPYLQMAKQAGMEIQSQQKEEEKYIKTNQMAEEEKKEQELKKSLQTNERIQESWQYEYWIQ